MFMDALALRTCTTYPPPTKPSYERNPMDSVTLQITINHMLDVIWPILPPHILEALTYV